MSRLAQFLASLLPPFGGTKSDRYANGCNDCADGLDDLSDTDSWLFSASESCSKSPSPQCPRKRSWLCLDIGDRPGLRVDQSRKSSSPGNHAGGGYKNVVAIDGNDWGHIDGIPKKLSGIDRRRLAVRHIWKTAER